MNLQIARQVSVFTKQSKIGRKRFQEVQKPGVKLLVE